MLIEFRNTTPNDFVRQPRSTKDIKHWKAVEFRNFLLYTGPIVLRYVLKRDIYIHFLTLHVAITILIRQNIYQKELINFAKALYHFVNSFEILYGKQYVSHNIHNLLHICSDVRTYGALDNFSAFRFKNCMSFIKKKYENTKNHYSNYIRGIMKLIIAMLYVRNIIAIMKHSCKFLHNMFCIIVQHLIIMLIFSHNIEYIK